METFLIMYIYTIVFLFKSCVYDYYFLMIYRSVTTYIKMEKAHLILMSGRLLTI